MGVFATVRLVTGGTALPEGRLVQVFLIALLGLIAMTGKKAGVHRIGTHKSEGFRRVGGMATETPRLSSLMLNYRAFRCLSGSFFVA